MMYQLYLLNAEQYIALSRALSHHKEKRIPILTILYSFFNLYRKILLLLPNNISYEINISLSDIFMNYVHCAKD